MKRLTTLAAILFSFALPLSAAAQHDHHADHHSATKAEQSDPVFAAYEDARQALMKGSLADLKTAARRIGAASHAAGQHKLMELAGDLEDAADLKTARSAFAALSSEAIKYRETRCCEKPVVAYCSMEKKSWLQPAGEIGNPYVDPSMKKCGEIKQK
jgi:hypothetical protein